ncbi:sigma 54-interacting transcriptional regulator [Longimicrobium sp.]|uniref:sigma 54-interacting transcriptional regulator n=1 Tax=Longimicrobium sp. TaxID=2029185 RepID=UPI002E373295|nr:sigma 54-interacting transcriptional regulator [Longimicrobium sp.]HEX6041381.1 sigma 54-interacting transcriptional regulator [Longimicrobium sp.]
MIQRSPSVGPEETDLARRVRLMSMERWGERRETVLVGRHESMLALQERVHRFAQATAPVLVTGETGTGKELFARAIYLLGPRARKPFFSVNCAQYTESQLIASELFGHKRGSFTGAFEDHRGVFVEADGGVVFLDEVGELTLPAQAMLLRVLSEGELVPVGDTRVRSVNVRVIAATNRDLRGLVAQGRFREDLLFRLRYLQLHVPPLRDRGADWQLMLEHYVHRLNGDTGQERRFSEASLERLGTYFWPGNVRELRAVVETSHSLCGAAVIEPGTFEEQLERDASSHAPTAAPAFGMPMAAAPAPGGAAALLNRMTGGAETFWDLVHEPFMDRELNRGQVRAVVEEGLRRSNWSYKRALQVFGIQQDDYLKFMDFLRHHRLKPER